MCDYAESLPESLSAFRDRFSSVLAVDSFPDSFGGFLRGFLLDPHRRECRRPASCRSRPMVTGSVVVSNASEVSSTASSAVSPNSPTDVPGPRHCVVRCGHDVRDGCRTAADDRVHATGHVTPGRLVTPAAVESASSSTAVTVLSTAWSAVRWTSRPVRVTPAPASPPVSTTSPTSSAPRRRSAGRCPRHPAPRPNPGRAPRRRCRPRPAAARPAAARPARRPIPRPTRRSLRVSPEHPVSPDPVATYLARPLSRSATPTCPAVRPTYPRPAVPHPPASPIRRTPRPRPRCPIGSRDPRIPRHRRYQRRCRRWIAPAETTVHRCRIPRTGPAAPPHRCRTAPAPAPGRPAPPTLGRAHRTPARGSAGTPRAPRRRRRAARSQLIGPGGHTDDGGLVAGPNERSPAREQPAPVESVRPAAGSWPSAVPAKPEKPEESVSTAAPNTELAASRAPAATAVRRTRLGPPSSSGWAAAARAAAPAGPAACGARPSRRSSVPTVTASRLLALVSTSHDSADEVGGTSTPSAG